MIRAHGVTGSEYGGWADYPFSVATYTSSSDLVLDTTNGPRLTGFDFQIILHELGHTLGLSHPHTGHFTLETTLDDTLTTVMSYNWAATPTDGLGSMDVDALTYLYGDSLDVTGWTYGFSGNVFEVQAAGGDDAILGVNARNTLKGGGGDDVIVGRKFADTFQGGSGNDLLKGMGGADVLRGGEGDDRLWASSQDVSDHARNQLFGGAGDDVLLGSAGADTLWGGNGNDILRAAAGGVTDRARNELHDGNGRDQLFGGKGGDLLKGDLGNDVIKAGMGNDHVRGGRGNDEISGGGGRDILFGNQGNDILSGHAGADTFRFDTKPSGLDTITDFTVGQDLLWFDGYTMDDLKIKGLGADTKVRWDNGAVILTGVEADALGASDFVFV